MTAMMSCHVAPSTSVWLCSERAGAEVARTGGEVAQLGGEVAQLGLRLRLSQESGAQLQREAAAFEHQALHYQTVFREHGERGRQAALLQVRGGSGPDVLSDSAPSQGA